MDRDELMKLARAAGFVTGTIDLADGNDSYPIVKTAVPGSCLVELERFYSMAVAAEREACAKVCEELPAELEEFGALNRAAAAIRARINL